MFALLLVDLIGLSICRSFLETWTLAGLVGFELSYRSPLGSERRGDENFRVIPVFYQ